MQKGYDIRTVQELLGHSNVETTQIYTHVLRQGGAGMRSPPGSPVAPPLLDMLVAQAVAGFPDKLSASVSSADYRAYEGTFGAVTQRFDF